MKLIVKEHRNIIAEPKRTVYKVYIDAVNSLNKIPSSIGTMKGDLIAFRGAGDPVRLPVGSNGKVLTADSSSPTGLVWTDAAGGGGGATVELYNPSGASVPAGSVVCALPYTGSDEFVGLMMVGVGDTTDEKLYVLSDNCPSKTSVQCYCVPDTVCPVLCDTDAVAIGDLLGVSSNGMGMCHSLEPSTNLGRATVGIALESKASGSVGTVKVRLVSNPTMQVYSASAVSTTYGTCFMVIEQGEGNSLRVAPVKKGKIPFGVQANKESVAGAAVLLHTHQNEEVAVMADTTEIKVGDWLVPSATADGQVRNGSGYGIGEALTKKTSGSAGLVRVHLNLKYGYSPRAWWLVGGITDDQVLAVYQFVGRSSEADALMNINNTQSSIPLINYNNNATWNADSGFYFPQSVEAKLTNQNIFDEALTVLSAGFGYSGATDSGISHGIIINKYRQLCIRGRGRSDVALNVHVISNASTVANPRRAGTFFTQGVLAGNWDTASKLFHNGTELATTAGSTNIVEATNFATMGNPNAASKSFYCTAVALYLVMLTAEQHLELANNIRALGGVDE